MKLQQFTFTRPIEVDGGLHMIVATIVGNIGKDAELRDAGQSRVCSFSIASNAKVKGEDVTTWIRASIWGERGEKLCQHLTKGTKVAISGTLSTREYEGKTYLELRVDQLEFAGERKQANGERTAVKRQPIPRAEPADAGEVDEDLLPF